MWDKVIWSIAYDEWLFSYDYEKVQDTVTQSIANIYDEIKVFKWSSLIERMKKLDEIKWLL
jgi:hypothetical protein